ncbi:MAG: hypothetical protein IKT98_03550 [Selenomonadaceae bacterium]|nr:hypothetical protein [Selenomonadaceae bacterium]
MFANMNDLVSDLERNYDNAIFRDGLNRNYRVVSVGDGTPESIIERLTARKKTKLIYLIAEETNE